MTYWNTDALMAEYLKAFAAANPDTPPPRLTYERGWIKFWEGAREDGRCRRAELAAMRDRLLKRPEDPPR